MIYWTHAYLVKLIPIFFQQSFYMYIWFTLSSTCGKKVLPMLFPWVPLSILYFDIFSPPHYLLLLEKSFLWSVFLTQWGNLPILVMSPKDSYYGFRNVCHWFVKGSFLYGGTTLMFLLPMLYAILSCSKYKFEDINHLPWIPIGSYLLLLDDGFISTTKCTSK